MKRVGEEQVNEEGTKRPKGDGVDTRWLVRSGEVGAIIGKKGSTVKNIRNESGSCVSILNKNQTVKSADAVMLVRGSEEVIANGVRMIVEAIVQSSRERDPSAPEETVLTMLVPSVQVGAIIGKGGEMIKSIISETAATIKISKEPLQGSTEKSVELSGNAAAISAATLRIMAELKNHPVKEGTARQHYRPGMQLEMQAPMGYGQQPQYGNPMMGMGQMGGQMGGMGQMGNYPPMQQQMPRNQASLYSTGQPSPVTQRSSEPLTGDNLKPGQMMQKVSIPSVSAGSVIGKRGAMIQNISKQTGCNIIIAPPEDEAQYERIVSIKGSAEGIDAAITMIRQVIETAQYGGMGGAPAY